MLIAIETHFLHSIQFSSVAQWCPLFVTPGTAAREASLYITNSQSLLKLTSIELVDAIQPSHPLSCPSPAFNLSQHQDLLQWVGSSHQVVKVMELQLQHQFFQWIVIFSSKLLKNSSASFKILDNLYWPTFCWKWKDQRQIFRSNSLSVFTNWKANLF